MKRFGPYLIFIAAMLWATDAPFRIHLTKELSSNFIVLGEHFVDVLFVLPILIMGFKGLKDLKLKVGFLIHKFNLMIFMEFLILIQIRNY